MRTRHMRQFWVAALTMVVLSGGLGLQDVGVSPACAADGLPTGLFAGSSETEPEVILDQDFEAGWGDWWSDAGIWDVGAPSSGPNGAYGGSQCAATVLDGKYPYGPDSRLISPQIHLPEIAEGEELLLRFHQWWSYGSSDRGYVQIQTFDEATGAWSEWTNLKEIYSYDSTWHRARVDLTDCADQWIQLAFYHQDGIERDGFGNNRHVESSGWYIDDLEIIKLAVPQLSGIQDFESGWNGWWCDRGIWEIGVPTTGAGSGYDSNQCVATILGGSYPYGPDSRLVSPQVQLSVVATGEELLLRFRQWWSYASSDRGYVQIQTFDEANGLWSNWTTLKEVYSYDSTWHRARVDLTAYAGLRVQLGFYHEDGIERDGFGNNQHVESLGWHIDNVEIVKQMVPSFCGLESFESGWDGWWCDCGIWEIGAPTGSPGQAYNGAHCAATKLGGNYPYGPDSILISPQIQLAQVTPPADVLLRFRQWWSYSSSDKGQVMARAYDESNDTWSGWDVLYEVAAYNTTNWHHARIPLTSYMGQRVQLGFRHEDSIERDGFGNNRHAESLGWYIDDVEIVPAPLCGTSLDISSTEGGSVTIPGEGIMPCSSGEVVCLEVEADEGYRFVRWEGTAVDAGKLDPDATDPIACVTVDGNYTLTAVFEPSCMVLYDFPMDSDPGWVLEGQWEFGAPSGQRCGDHGHNDPSSGATGSNVLGVNLDGCYDLAIGGPYYAVAGPFDLTGYEDVTLRFQRWLNSDIPEYAKAALEISTDGQTWTVLWTQAEREEITDTEWTQCEYALPQADCEPEVYLRWGYEIVQERVYAYTGWNLDDVQLIGCTGCDQ